MASLKLEVPSTDDSNSLADWLELTMLLLGRKTASKSWVRGQLRQVMLSGTRGNDFDVTFDELVSEVARRKLSAGDGYPFSPDPVGSGVRLDPDQTHATYAFLLLVSGSPSMREESRHREVDEAFDRLIAETLKAYLGSGCRVVRFGSPPSNGRPTNFRDAIPWLAKQLGLPTGHAPARSHSGDGGVDVVAWLPFPDTHLGFLVVLAQCTIKLKWSKKGHDIIADVWRGYIDFGKDPVSCLAVPFAIPLGDPRWDELRRATTVVLDRLRVARLTTVLPAALKKNLTQWASREATKLGADANVFDWAS
jgi:hypothetical protein